MYRVVLVEDEEWIRKGLRFLLPWEKFHCRIVGEAENGEEGEREILRLRPDLVVTDIRMPRCDGLTMLRRLEERRPRPDFSALILSSYDDFPLCQEAMKLGVNEYLLKPVAEEEMAAAIARMTERRKREAREKTREDLLMIRERLFADLPLIQDQGRSTEWEEMMEYIHRHACEKLKPEELSRRFYRSLSRFNAEFKAHTGYSFHDYLNRYRIALALKKMQESASSIADVALETGFEDSKYFTRVFRKYLGKSPREMREQLSSEGRDAESYRATTAGRKA